MHAIDLLGDGSEEIEEGFEAGSEAGEDNTCDDDCVQVNGRKRRKVNRGNKSDDYRFMYV